LRWSRESTSPSGEDDGPVIVRPARPPPTSSPARRFVDWNGLAHGIQRVDACRAPDGEPLSTELEDLNPYLSLDALDEAGRDAFVAATTRSPHGFLAG
jgi:hypothetical protein